MTIDPTVFLRLQDGNWTRNTLVDHFHLDARQDENGAIEHFSGRRQQVWHRRRRPIGKGGFGIVWLEQESRGKTRVIKEIEKVLLGTSEKYWIRELYALAGLSNNTDYFPAFYGWFQDLSHVYIAMEYFPLGDLQRCVRDPLPENEAQLIVSQVAQSLRVLHDFKYTHRDLKPMNIFVRKTSPSWHVVLADFGLSKRVREYSTQLNTSINGYFMAPEMDGLVDDGTKGVYTSAVDLWSLGCLAYWLMHTKGPISRHEMGPYCNRKLRKTPVEIDFKNTSDCGQRFIMALLKPEPASRPTAVEACNHEWIRSQPMHFSEYNDTASHLPIKSAGILAETYHTAVEDHGIFRSKVHPEVLPVCTAEISTTDTPSKKKDQIVDHESLDMAWDPSASNRIRSNTNDDIQNHHSRKGMSKLSSSLPSTSTETAPRKSVTSTGSTKAAMANNTRSPVRDGNNVQDLPRSEKRTESQEITNLSNADAAVDLTAENLKTLSRASPQRTDSRASRTGTSMSIDIKNGPNLRITEDGSHRGSSPPFHVNVGGLQISVHSKDQKKFSPKKASPLSDAREGTDKVGLGIKIRQRNSSNAGSEKKPAHDSTSGSESKFREPKPTVSTPERRRKSVNTYHSTTSPKVRLQSGKAEQVSPSPVLSFASDSSLELPNDPVSGHRGSSKLRKPQVITVEPQSAGQQWYDPNCPDCNGYSNRPPPQYTSHFMPRPQLNWPESYYLGTNSSHRPRVHRSNTYNSDPRQVVTTTSSTRPRLKNSITYHDPRDLKPRTEEATRRLSHDSYKPPYVESENGDETLLFKSRKVATSHSRKK